MELVNYHYFFKFTTLSHFLEITLLLIVFELSAFIGAPYLRAVTLGIHYLIEIILCFISCYLFKVLDNNKSLKLHFSLKLRSKYYLSMIKHHSFVYFGVQCVSMEFR